MAITLADDELSDAEITDGIGLGRIDSAARLWVRYWPTALATAREYVEAAEVPGLAAEALIGTIAAIAVGHGPREDAHTFVVDAVRELGEGEAAPPGEPVLPDVFVSALMSRAFSELPETDQDVLRGEAGAGRSDASLAALGTLQRDYLALHVERAEGIPCIQVHNYLSTATTATTSVLSGEAWVHLSSCAVCTEAFHEVAFSNVALEALLPPAALEVSPVSPAPPVPAVPPVPLVEEPAVGVVAAEDVGPASSEDTVVLAFPPPDAEVDPVDDETADDDGAAVVPVRPRRKRRGVLAGIVAVAATIAVVTVVLGNQGEPDRDKDLASAEVPQQTQQPGTPTPTAYVEPPVAEPTDDATGTPVGQEVDELPTAVATEAATGAATAAAAPTKSPKPSKTPTPSKTPKPSAAPSTSSPEPTPQQPTPSATPTKNACNPLAHLLGMC